MDHTVFITNSSACLNLRASDLSTPPVGMILVGQIFLPSGFLPAVRGVAVRLICLLLCSQIECVHSGCVNGQKCGTGTWHAGLVKRNFSHSLLCNQNSEFIPAIMSGVLLLGRGWNLRCLCVIYKLHMWIFSSDNLRKNVQYFPSYFHSFDKLMWSEARCYRWRQSPKSVPTYFLVWVQTVSYISKITEDQRRKEKSR